MKSIQNEDQYNSILQEIEQLMTDADSDGPVIGERIDMLSKLIEDYERIHYPMDWYRHETYSDGLYESIPPLGNTPRQVIIKDNIVTVIEGEVLGLHQFSISDFFEVNGIPKRIGDIPSKFVDKLY